MNRTVSSLRTWGAHVSAIFDEPIKQRGAHMKGTDVWLHEHSFHLCHGRTMPTQRSHAHGLALVLGDQQDPPRSPERSKRRRDLLCRCGRILNAVLISELGVCPRQILREQLCDGLVVGARNGLAQDKL
jgi:hypothetical protein